MAGNDDLIARLNGWAEAIRRFDIAAAHTLNEGTTALAERDAQIERLEEHSAARAQDIITLGQQIGQLTRERDELLSRTTEYARQNVDLEARATTAERERDDARAERDRLEDERAEEWRKRRNAEGDRDVLNAANGTLRKELSEARAEVERLRGLLEHSNEQSGISGLLEDRIAAALYADGSDLCDVPWEQVPSDMKIGYFSAASRVLTVLPAIRQAIADEKMAKAQLYRAGLIAGLREADRVATEAMAVPENTDDPAALVMAIRARIAALETEEGKS